MTSGRVRAGIAALALLSVVAVHERSRRALAAAADDPRPPHRLSETGLYAPGQPGVIDPRNRAFSPQYPLWTDGAAKSRWVYLPPGAAIDASDPYEWNVPVGARFWKEFRFDGRKVETRLIWRASTEKWVFASYMWDADGTDATLAPERGVRNVAEVAPGRFHGIPATTDCVACHVSGRPQLLGFNALQLSPDRDPGAIHGEPLAPGMITLNTLARDGLLSPVPAHFLAQPPAIRTSSPRTRSMLGYFAANCGSCHNGRGEISALGPVITQRDLLDDGDRIAGSLVGQLTRWQVPGKAEGESALVDPVDPDRSAIVVRMRSRSPSSQMPPLGTVLRDQTALEALNDWIADLVPEHSRRRD